MRDLMPYRSELCRRLNQGSQATQERNIGSYFWLGCITTRLSPDKKRLSALLTT